MRQRRVEATAGVVNARGPSGRRVLVRGGAAVAVAWLALAFAQEAWTAHRLAAQAADLRQQNAAIAAQNQEYRRDIATVKSGAAAEEVARSSGYSKPDEKVFVVASPAPAAGQAAGAAGAGGASGLSGPSGSSGGAPRPARSAGRVEVRQTSPSFGDVLRSWWQWFWRWRL